MLILMMMITMMMTKVIVQLSEMSRRVGKWWGRPSSSSFLQRKPRSSLPRRSDVMSSQLQMWCLLMTFNHPTPLASLMNPLCPAVEIPHNLLSFSLPLFVMEHLFHYLLWNIVSTICNGKVFPLFVMGKIFQEL